jgi:small-conductance mechanosensitive channel
VDLGYSQRQVVVGYMVLSAVFGIVALVVASRVVKLVALVALAGVVALALALLAKRSEP